MKLKLTHIGRSTLIIAFFFALDKGLGLARSVLFNRTFTAADRDIFFVSNNIPDLLSALISGGALGMALIPVLSEVLGREGRPAAWALFSRIANLAFLITAAIAAFIMLLAEPLVQYIIAPGFNDPEKWALAARLMRLDLLAIIIFSISGLVMAGLQANQHFWLPAMAPGLYNLGQIAGIVLLGPHFGIYGMVIGVITGALLHLAIQLPGLWRYGFRWAPRLDLNSPNVRQVLRLMGPRAINMLFLHFYFLFRDNFASFHAESAVSALNNGWFIQQVPETLIGTAVAIALLPTLAEQFAAGEHKRFAQTINQALSVLLALTLPIAVVLSIVIRPLAQTVFDWQGAELEMATMATRFFLLGLMGHTWLEVAVRSYYAQQQPRYPVWASFFQALGFLAIGALLSNLVGLAGIALADTLTFSAQALALLILLRKNHAGLLDVRQALLRGLGAAAAGGVVSYALMSLLPLPQFYTALVALLLGGLAALPFIWQEIINLLHLGANAPENP